MKKNLCMTLVVGLIATFGVAQADVENRYFQIQVKQIAGGQSPFFAPPSPPGPNCYSFLEDGTWLDPLFLGPPLGIFPGIWELVDSIGAVTRYTAMADSPAFPVFDLPALTLVQEGQITPTTGNGKVRLQAFSTVYVAGTLIVLAEFMSTGYEVDTCPE